MLEEKRNRKGIYILPNLFTTAGLFVGFYAIVQATQGHYEAAAIAIFVAMLMDGVDGRIARLTNTTSDFGSAYDSLVDMVAFGVTPALVVYEWALAGQGKIGWLAAFIYVAATALRLARFSTQKVSDTHYFQGLPSPSAAALIGGMVWVGHSYELSGTAFEGGAAAFTILVSLAMVSHLKYRSFKDFDLKGKVPFVAALLMVFIFVLVALDPPRVLFVGFVAYLLSGPVLYLLRWRRRGGDDAQAPRTGTDDT